jgi:hypothetical protein
MSLAWRHEDFNIERWSNSAFLPRNQQGDQNIGKNSPIFLKVAKKSPNPKKCQHDHTQTQFESPKHLLLTTLEALKYEQQTMFRNGLFRGKCKNLCKQKEAQNVAISLGSFIFFKIIMSFQK